jgi:serine/threonine protein kinase/tetratricopeptide (TPR) repeat protein
MTLNEERGKQIQAVFLAALEISLDDRDAWLAEQCGQDKQLLHEVRSLLAHDNKDDDLLEKRLHEAFAEVPSKIISGDDQTDNSADRNLLFGVLAYQIDFLTRDQLAAGISAWVRDKSKSLGQLFVELGHLSESRRDLLEPLVAENVRQHGGDPTRSLAAISSSREATGALVEIADQDIQNSLTHIRISRAIVTETPHGDTPVQSSASDSRRFRVLRPHARGGLGQVYVARDEELGRQVALKEIRPDRADDADLRSRFVLEAEINGNLEHPGIVPVYGLGSYPDGRPFYAMRFVEGDSLKEAIARFHGSQRKEDTEREPSAAAAHRHGVFGSLEFRQLLGRFVDVCEAIEYAHSRGVLHRDLKPANIMLGKFGETLVVDWGLAKAAGMHSEKTPKSSEGKLVPQSGRSLDPTLAGSAVGTPQFMSPEQAEGRLDDLGPSTDVYALGATLYQVLTGRPPVEGGELGDLLRRVVRGDIAPPRTVCRDVPKSLEAVCLKAMSRNQEDRYSSAQALAEDIERWLADEPVTAMIEPWHERARRWSRKHRTFVTTASTLVLAGLLGVTAFAAVVGAKNRELRSTNDDLDKQRTRAEKREEAAIAAVKRYADTVRENEVLRNSPSLKPLRNALLSEPLAFFQDLREQLQADSDTSTEALVRLADAAFQMGHLTKEIAGLDDAVRAHREALALQEQLVQQNPENADFQSALGAIHLHLGQLLRKTGDTSKASEAFKSAETLQQQLVEEHPGVAQYRRELAVTRDNMGLILSDTSQLDKAIEHHQSAAAVRKQLAQEQPNLTELELELATSHNNIGNILLATGKPKESLAEYNLALEIVKRQLAVQPGHRESREDLARNHANRARVLAVLGQATEALAAFEAAVTVFQQLVNDYPSITQHQSDLGRSQAMMGNLLRLMQDVEKSQAAFEAAAAIFRRLIREHPAVTQYQRYAAACEGSLGNLLFTTGQWEKAVEAYEAACVIQERLVKSNPEIAELRNNLGTSHNNIGEALRKLEKYDEALAAFRASVAIRQELAAANPEVPAYELEISRGIRNIALLLSQTGKIEESLESYGKALSIQEQLAQDFPEVPEYSSDTAVTLNNAASVQLDQEDFEPARDKLQRAVEWQSKALDRDPNSTQYRQFLKEHLCNLVDACVGLYDQEGAAEARRRLEELD